MDRIISMLKRVDYTDIMFTMEFLCVNGELPEDDGTVKIAVHRVKFGKGWMGKNAEIHRISNLWGQPKDITVSINIFKYAYFINIGFCAISNLRDREDVVHLDGPSGINYKYCWDSFHRYMS